MLARNILGVLSIVAGLTLIIVSLGTLIFRIIIALFGLGLVNYGMRLRSQVPFVIWAQRTFYRR